MGAPRALQSVTCWCLHEADSKVWNNHDGEVQQCSQQVTVQDELLGLKIFRRVHEIDPPGDQQGGGSECALKVKEACDPAAVWWPPDSESLLAEMSLPTATVAVEVQRLGI